MKKVFSSLLILLSFASHSQEAVINGYVIKPGVDLSGVDLSSTDLRGIDFRGVRLRDVDLSHTDLRGANLSGQDLGGATLRYADLRGADMSNTSMYRTDIYAAHFEGVSLCSSDWDFDIYDFCVRSCPSCLPRSMEEGTGEWSLLCVPDYHCPDSLWTIFMMP